MLDFVYLNNRKAWIPGDFTRYSPYDIRVSLIRQHDKSLQDKAHHIHTEVSLGNKCGPQLCLGVSVVRGGEPWTPHIYWGL